jgi:LmbE family N-acetylglucosaminyl deacetylase
MKPRRLTAVLAHPDDESFPIGGTLARYAAAGIDVHLIAATRGEAGIPGKSPAETAAIRERELQRACAELGVSQISFLDFIDGQLANVSDDEGIGRMAKVLRHSQPDVMITFGPDGISGHLDHVTISRWTTAAFDGLHQEPGGPQRLYYIVPSEATQQGCGIAPPPNAVEGPIAYIDVGDYLIKKARAAQQHRSQNPPFTGDPVVEAQRLACHETFRLARPRHSANGRRLEVDLFP